MSVNTVLLVGRLGTAPELRTTTGGKTLCTFRMATDRFGNEGADGPDWHSVVCWGRTAELCHHYLDKGRLVAIEGRIKNQTWRDDAGKPRFKSEIIAGRVTFLGGRNDAREVPMGGTPQTTHATSQPVSDDLPF